MVYLINKFQAAVVTLGGRGPIKQRLASAFLTHLDDLHDDEMPPEYRADFVGLRKKLTGVAPLNGEGLVRASVRKMSPQEAAECSEAIIGMFTGLLQENAAARNLHLVENEPETAPYIPRFLVKS